MNILKYETKIANWIENHRFLWGFCLVGLGIICGLGSNLLLGGTPQQGIVMTLSYCFLLVTAEVFMGGSGYQK